jgi:hypothetical protein
LRADFFDHRELIARCDDDAGLRGIEQRQESRRGEQRRQRHRHRAELGASPIRREQLEGIAEHRSDAVTARNTQSCKSVRPSVYIAIELAPIETHLAIVGRTPGHDHGRVMGAITAWCIGKEPSTRLLRQSATPCVFSASNDHQSTASSSTAHPNEHEDPLCESRSLSCARMSAGLSTRQFINEARSVKADGCDRQA